MLKTNTEYPGCEISRRMNDLLKNKVHSQGREPLQQIYAAGTSDSILTFTIIDCIVPYSNGLPLGSQLSRRPLLQTLRHDPEVLQLGFS